MYRTTLVHTCTTGYPRQSSVNMNTYCLRLEPRPNFKLRYFTPSTCGWYSTPSISHAPARTGPYFTLTLHLVCSLPHLTHSSYVQSTALRNTNHYQHTTWFKVCLPLLLSHPPYKPAWKNYSNPVRYTRHSRPLCTPWWFSGSITFLFYTDF